MMKSNLTKPDRLLRLTVGIGLFSLTFLLQGALRWTGLIGGILLLTSLINWCPLYALFGYSGRTR